MYLEAAKHSVEPALTVTEQDTYLYQSGWYRRVIGPFFGSDDPAFFVSVDRMSSLFSEKEKVAEDIILSIEKSIGNLVDINFINKQYEQGEQSEVVILELNFSSNSKNLFKIDKKLKELDLYDSIEMIKIENSQTETDQDRKINCTMTFRVV